MKIDSDDGFLTIPKGGIKESFWSYVERVTGKRSLSKFLWRGTILTLFSMFPTIFGSVLRGIVYKAILGSIGSGCLIEKNVRINGPGKIFLGKRVFVGEGSLLDTTKQSRRLLIEDDVYISRYTALRAGMGEIHVGQQVSIGEGSLIDGNGELTIGRNTLLARGVVLLSGNHVFENPNVPIRFQGTEVKKVTIGEDVWLGAYVVVLPGVIIGDGTVIGAGAVVTEDIPSYSLAVGVPAKVIGKRR